ncbi:MAG: Rieske (2Fe-2S) protein [Chloroflexi bacterium]|nr:Rieske (2Fe-2S) protein [Chloroflexota bacterium]
MKQVVVCKATEIAPGERRIVDVEGRSIGIFNVEGRFLALRNKCPHRGGALCEGPLTGTTLPVEDRTFVYGRAGRILRCAWHGWEFDVESGQALADPTVRVQTYRVTVEDGQIILTA